MLGDMRDARSLVLGSVARHLGATVRHYYCRLLEAQLKQLSGYDGMEHEVLFSAAQNIKW